MRILSQRSPPFRKSLIIRCISWAHLWLVYAWINTIIRCAKFQTVGRIFVPGNKYANVWVAVATTSGRFKVNGGKRSLHRFLKLSVNCTQSFFETYVDSRLFIRQCMYRLDQSNGIVQWSHDIGTNNDIKGRKWEILLSPIQDVCRHFSKSSPILW